MKKHSISEIKNALNKKGYKFFEKGRYNLNLIGIRANNSKSDKFDDHFHLIYKDSSNLENHVFNCTTDSGKHWLLNPMNVRGTAIVVPDQYQSVYKLGIHGRSWSSGGYEALEQRLAMKYVRDNSKDDELNFDLYRNPELAKEEVFVDFIKTNIHRASKWKEVLNVGRYSAGCQVIQDPKDFSFLIKVCKVASIMWGNKFTYTLIEENDL